MKLNFLKRSATLLFIAAIALLQSCTSSEQQVKIGATGFYVVNEGVFGKGNTTISFYDRTKDAVVNDVFAAKNGRILGDQAQSMTIFQNNAYIVVQNSAKIEVANASDLSSFASVTGLPSPRYFIGIDSKKGYVSDWGSDGVTGTVKVIDLTTFLVTKTIPTGKGANRMLKVNNLVYVANSGGYDKDNTVKVIDSNTDAIIATITVGDNPNSLQRDKDGNIWVASTGYIDYVNSANSTKGSISKISASNTEALRISAPAVTYLGPSNLDITADGQTLYYTYDGGIYSLPVTSTTFPANAFKAKSYYGLAVDPINGNIIGCDAGNFSSAGTIDIYDSKANLIKTYNVGISPNGCTFK